MKIKTINLNKNYYIIKNNLKISLNKLFFKQKFILGNEVNILEKKLSTYLKVKYSLGVSSGSDALIVALLGCGIKKNDEVIIPDMTWISTASSIIFVGAKPVLADVNISDGTINIESLKNKITKKTKAIISVGLYGHLPQLDKLSKIAKGAVKVSNRIVQQPQKPLYFKKIEENISMHWRTNKKPMGEKNLEDLILDDDKKKYLMPIFQNEEVNDGSNGLIADITGSSDSTIYFSIGKAFRLNGKKSCIIGSVEATETKPSEDMIEKAEKIAKDKNKQCK